MVQPRLTDALSNRKVTFLFQNVVLLYFFFHLFVVPLLKSLLISYIIIGFFILSITIVQVEVAQDLRGILIRIGRFKSLEAHYTKVHLKPIRQLWEDFDSKQRTNKLANEKNEVERLLSSNDFQSILPTISFSSWLPSFYDELLLYLEQEWKWYCSNLSIF